MTSALSLASARFRIIPFLNHLLDEHLCLKNILLFPYFRFLVFNDDFIIYMDFTRIAASDTASDDVTNLVTNRISNTDVLYIVVLML